MEDTTLNVFQRLLEVQKEAKAPRSIDGKFGKARSAEQILEAYKPVCNKHGLYLSTSDTMHLEGDRHYIKSVATVVNVAEPTETFSATAEAWEGEIPKNKYDGDIIDSSQLTGKTSSYAKKYALQNLFAIDDTKDADKSEKDECRFSVVYVVDVRSSEVISLLLTLVYHAMAFMSILILLILLRSCRAAY